MTLPLKVIVCYAPCPGRMAAVVEKWLAVSSNEISELTENYTMNYNDMIIRPSYDDLIMSRQSAAVISMKVNVTFEPDIRRATRHIQHLLLQHINWIRTSER